LRGQTWLDGSYSTCAESLDVDDRCTKLTAGASAHTDYLNWLL
jgi:hypothetical protein